MAVVEIAVQEHYGREFKSLTGGSKRCGTP